MTDSTSSKPNGAMQRIREIVGKGHEITGATAYEFTPGAVVLLVLRAPEAADMFTLDQARKAAAGIADALRAEGIRAVCVALPHGWDMPALVAPDVSADAAGGTTT